MNFFRKVILRVMDPLIKKCLWQRLYNVEKQKSNSPSWLNQLMYCDCSNVINHYHSAQQDYPDYLWQHSFLSCIEKRQNQRLVKHWQYKPLISIQLPVYKVDLGQLQACLDSVAKQLYPHWQLCIVEDGCQELAIQEMLVAFRDQFPKQVKLNLREDNKGITITSQEAFELTDGEFVALLDHDDYLAPEALFEVVRLINEKPDTDWVYSDNDQIDPQGQRCCHHAKPAWSPELLMTYNYILHLSVIRRSLMQQAGGFRSGFEGSQDHDLYLRLSELTKKIRHIPRILYSWRQSENSVALNPGNKAYAFDAALKALNAALKRRGEAGEAIYPKHSWLGSYQIIRSIDKPLIDVIHLNTKHPDISKLALQKQVILGTKMSLATDLQVGKELYKLINDCQSPYLLLLAPTIQLTENTQLFQMASQLSINDVAVSLAKIINTKDQVDHCGIAYVHGGFRYPLRGWDKNHDGIGAYGALPRNISLCTPLFGLYRTQELLPILNKLSEYQTLSGWLIALSFELHKRQQRICVDGGISVLNMQDKPYQIYLTDDEIAMLKTNFPSLLSDNDPLYHYQMN